MSEGGMFIIKVPASSANLGPGFDSIGLAVNLYLTITASKSNSWEVVSISKELDEFPKDETNFICETAIKLAASYHKTMPPCRLTVKSDIPLARGLGSSAAAIVAGIELADVFCELNLSKDEKLLFASQVEGHPDNVGACLFGGLFIGYQTETEISQVVFSNLNFDIVAVVPKELLLTKASRDVLPDKLEYAEAVKAGAVANVLVAALLSQNWPLAGKMMKSDRYHQPYRRKLIPHLASIEKVATEKGAFGVAISGAGPTVLCLAETGKGKLLAETLQEHFCDMEVLTLGIDRTGSVVTTGELQQCR
jgi:homoserine kinase